MTLQRYLRIKPLSSFHLGEDGDLSVCSDRIRADTIWSALVSMAFQLNRHDLLPRMINSQSFLISSGYPFWKGIRFLPKPFLKVQWSTEISNRKKIREASFVSERVLERMINSDELSLDDFVFIGCCLLDKMELPKGKIPEWLVAADTTTSNIVDRLTSMTDLFDRTDLRVNMEAEVEFGFWIRCQETLFPEICELFKELGNQGLGGERSVGKGAFSWAGDDDIELQKPTGTVSRFLTLSPYYPTKEEVKAGVLQGAAYQLITRGGWIDGLGIKRKRIRMLQEGSILTAVSKDDDYGEIVEVQPSGFKHPIWRFGRAYPIFLEGAQ